MPQLDENSPSNTVCEQRLGPLARTHLTHSLSRRRHLNVSVAAVKW